MELCIPFTSSSSSSLSSLSPPRQQASDAHCGPTWTQAQKQTLALPSVAADRRQISCAAVHQGSLEMKQFDV